MNGRLLLAGGFLFAITGFASAQSRGGSSGGSSGFGSSGSSGSSSSGFSGQVGSLGGFRSNTSGFGQPSSLLTANSSSNSKGTDAFGATRQDALSMNRATGSSSTGSRGRNSGNRGSSQFGGMSGMNGGRGGMNNFGQQNSQQSTRRTQMSAQISFEVPKLDSKAVVAAAQSPLATNVMPAGAGVSVQILEGVAVLTGSVPSKRDAALAAAVVSLEPGVRSIDNRLEVKAASEVK